MLVLADVMRFGSGLRHSRILILIILQPEASMAKKARKKVARQPKICIVTVTGEDKVGIIARLSAAMADKKINIVDVNQKIMETYFVMTMACDMADATVTVNEISEILDRIGEEMGLQITFQHENIFKAMHRV
jgi:ACT domain-containing protein